MSHLSDTVKIFSFNNETVTGTIDVPGDVRIIEILAYPNGVTQSVAGSVGLRFNSDSGTNYNVYNQSTTWLSGYSWSSALATTGVLFYNNFAASATDQSCTRMVLYPNCDINYNEGFFERMLGSNGSEGESLYTQYFSWLNSTDKITSLTLYQSDAGTHSLDLEIKFIR